ncbi:hypothetical protein L7F22_066946 [Adiantum nelumboides]|nr:hypothetical protein [Adiantum nelumboides]
MKSALDLLFGFLAPEWQTFADQVFAKDRVQLVGVLGALDRALLEADELGNDFLLRTLGKLHIRLTSQLEKFISEQIRAIEQTKLTVKKRKGVAHFIKVFPTFVERIEAQLLNSEDVGRLKGSAALGPLLKRAQGILEDALSAYVQSALRRPLGKMMDFGDGIDALLRSTPANEVSLHSAYNRQAAKRLVKEYSSKDIRKSIEALSKRVIKHFDDEEITTLSEGINGASNFYDTSGISAEEIIEVLGRVWRNLEDGFTMECERMQRILRECYANNNDSSKLLCDFTMEDVGSHLRAAPRRKAPLRLPARLYLYAQCYLFMVPSYQWYFRPRDAALHFNSRVLTLRALTVSHHHHLHPPAMSALSFLSKKSWHTGLQQNQEAVWKAEKSALEERRKLDELRKERDREREIQELERLQEEAGGKKKRVDKVDWMYNAPASGSNVDKGELEDYLLGKKRVDKLLKRRGGAAAFSRNQEGPISEQKAVGSDRDVAAKIREDPMFAIRQQEQAAYQALLKDPRQTARNEESRWHGLGDKGGAATAKGGKEAEKAWRGRWWRRWRRSATESLPRTEQQQQAGPSIRRRATPRFPTTTGDGVKIAMHRLAAPARDAVVTTTTISDAATCDEMSGHRTEGTPSPSDAAPTTTHATATRSDALVLARGHRHPVRAAAKQIARQSERPSWPPCKPTQRACLRRGQVPRKGQGRRGGKRCEEDELRTQLQRSKERGYGDGKGSFLVQQQRDLYGAGGMDLNERLKRSRDGLQRMGAD